MTRVERDYGLVSPLPGISWAGFSVSGAKLDRTFALWKLPMATIWQERRSRSR